MAETASSFPAEAETHFIGAMVGEATMRRYVAPAGTPIPLADILRACLGFSKSDGLATIAHYIGVPHVFGASSGRTALWLILRALHTLRPERRVVAIPAYTCFSVPAAVVRAGLKIYPIDVNPETLELDYVQLEQVPEDNLLCMVTANLFGYVNDLEKIEALARAKGAFLVDDAAQAMGASRDGRLAGTAGHAGFFSLARGKPLPAGQGGIIVTRFPDVAAALIQAMADLAKPSPIDAAALALNLLSTSVFLRPSLYRVPNSLPFLKLGLTEYNPNFRTRTLPRVSRVLLGKLVPDLDPLNANRRAKANSIAARISGHTRFAIPKPCETCRPTFIRLPVLSPDEQTRNLAVKALNHAGIGATASYPHSICDIEAIVPHMALRDFHRRQSEELSRRIFTLPTHPFVSSEDIEHIAAVLRRVG